jgi:hypothetical protein
VGEYVFGVMVGMARRALLPAREVAGGTSVRATLACEGVAPLNAARTSRRDFLTRLNTYRSPDRAIFKTRAESMKTVWTSAFHRGRFAEENNRAKALILGPGGDILSQTEPSETLPVCVRLPNET